MNTWGVARKTALGGYHRIVVTPRGGSPVDVTFFRDVPTQLPSYSSADPFGDSVSQLLFPQITPLDDFGTPELNWCVENSDVDIWWVPAMAKPSGWLADSGDMAPWQNTITGNADIVCPFWEYEKVDGSWQRKTPHVKRGTKVFEGFIASIDDDLDQNTGTVTASLQGALFEVDSTLAKPFFPPRPQALEDLILREFGHEMRPSLHTHRAVIQWPAGWSLVAPAFTGSDNVFDPNVSPGAKWTGYTTRQTGSWDHVLTSYIAQMLAVMLVKPGSGTEPGNQWTLRLAHEGDDTYPAGRTPVLSVRDRYKAERFSMWAGIPGMELHLTRDATQAENSIYGTGTDFAGTNWSNAIVSDDGARTDFRPLIALPAVYPVAQNKAFDPNVLLRESYVQYGTGFSQVDATDAAAQTLQRDRDPGYSGTITLRTDPSADLSRWEIVAGDTFVLKGHRGTGATGRRFHIAQVDCNVSDGSVTLTVDTRYRDLLTLQEALTRTRDALTPAKLLNLNRNTVTIEDIQAPWDYNRGSGCLPWQGRVLWQHKPSTSLYPYVDWVKAHPPKKHWAEYVRIDASNPDSKGRWSKRRVLMAEKGSIRRSEFFLVDWHGNPVAIPFSVSLYYLNGINAAAMPNNGKTWSPFIDGAFEALDPSTGQPWRKGINLAPPTSMVIGWGNYAQPAGYSPGLKTDGAAPTGLLVDDQTWTFDCSANNPDYLQIAKAGHERSSFISIWAMCYAEYTEPVYLAGRLFKEEPGTT